MDVIFLGTSEVGNRIYDWLCEREGVHVLAMLTTEEQLSVIPDLQPDIIVSVGFMYQIPPEILNIPPQGAINLHGSYLPYNRRRNANVWPIVEHTPAGVTLHYMNDEYDEGQIIAQKRIDVPFDYTAKDLFDELCRINYELFTNTWPDIEQGNVSTQPQEGEGTSHTTADFEELCRLHSDDTYTVRELIDVLRATTFPPFDNAHITVDGERYYIDIDVRKAEESDDEKSYQLVDEY